MSTKLNPAREMREHANTSPSAFNPFWVDEAKRLLVWAADLIEAANAAILPKEVK